MPKSRDTISFAITSSAINVISSSIFSYYRIKKSSLSVSYFPCLNRPSQDVPQG